MEHRATIADLVTAHTAKEDGDLTVHLASGHELLVRGNDPHLPGWTQALTLSETEHFPVYFEFDSASRIVQLLLLCSPRTAEAIHPQGTGDVTVVFRRAPSYYTLKSSRAHFENMLALLRKSAESRTPLFVAVEPSTLEILHVQEETSH